MIGLSQYIFPDLFRERYNLLLKGHELSPSTEIKSEDVYNQLMNWKSFSELIQIARPCEIFNMFPHECDFIEVSEDTSKILVSRHAREEINGIMSQAFIDRHERILNDVLFSRYKRTAQILRVNLKRSEDEEYKIKIKERIKLLSPDFSEEEVLSSKTFNSTRWQLKKFVYLEMYFPFLDMIEDISIPVDKIETNFMEIESQIDDFIEEYRKKVK